MPKKRYFSRILYKNCASFCLSLSLSLKRIGRSDARQRRRLGVKETPGERCWCWHRRRHRLSRKKSARQSWPDPIFKQRLCICSRAKSGSRGGEEKTMTEDRNQTLADALEELGFRGHVPKQWVPMVAEVRRARLLSILRPGGVAVFRGVFWILDFCTEARRVERRVSVFEKREEAKDRERRTSRGARKIFHDDGRNRVFFSLHDVLN